MTISWSQPAAATIQSKYWNYAGNPTSTAVTTTPQTILSAVTSPRAIAYSANGTEGIIIKIWINSDPATDPPTLRSYTGHNACDWPVSGAFAVATESGTATIIIDTAIEATTA